MKLAVVILAYFAYALATGRVREALLLTAQLIALLVAFVALMFVSVGELAWAPVLLISLAGVFPWTAARRVFAPLGLWQPAWLLGEMARQAWRGPGGGLVAGARALLRQRSPSPGGLRWLEGRLSRARGVAGAHVLGAGLLAAARGDHDGARALLESIEGISLGGERARRLAREWLSAEAAEEGDWRRVVQVARRPGATTRATRFLGGAGARLADHDDAPGDRRLVFLWALAPRRRYTRGLLTRALRRRPPGPLTRPIPSPPDIEISGRDPLGLALALHILILSRPPREVQMQDLELLGQAWDSAFADTGTRRRLRKRAEVLGAPSSERAAEELTDEVERELAAIARSAGHRLDLFEGGSRTVEAAVRRAREDILSEIEVAFDALGKRTEERRAHPPIDEWREYLALRTLYQQAADLGGISLRRLAFPQVHHLTCNFAVWLWNEREEYPLANAMFRWLLEEAIAVGDQEAIELQRHNVEPKNPD